MYGQGITGLPEEAGGRERRSRRHSTGSVEVLTLTTCSPGVSCAALFLEHTDGLGILQTVSY